MGNPGAFAIIETPTTYVLEGPDLEATDTFLLRFFGGSVDSGDATPRAAIGRELREELGLDLPDGQIEDVWCGPDPYSQTRHNLVGLRWVDLFRVRIDSADELAIQEERHQGRRCIVEIPRDPEAVEEYRRKMTRLAYLALSGKLEREAEAA